MTTKIRVLDELTINQIAAGEVIENPASVVKELVENSIDAGASEIAVEIKGGGRQLIRITDDGCGMVQDDAVLSLERHATSKLRQIEDFDAIGTMGFRGEAIPSIASISKFSLLTNPGTEEMGTLVRVEGGKMISCTPAARGKGTTIEVKELFFNVPARKKFQRSPTYDANEILKVVTVQALGNPEIKFKLTHNQQLLLSSNLPKERIRDVLGAEFASGLCPVDHTKEGMQIKGYVGLPAFTRHNRTGQYLFINNRAVSSSLINSAIREGYGTTLPTNRHPVFLLHLTIPGSTVDVNVHPQKREVRLRQEQLIKELFFEGVDRALQHTGVSYSTSTPYVAAEPAVTYEVEPKFTPPTKEWTPPPLPRVEEKPPEPLELFAVEEERIRIPQVQTTIPGYIVLEPEEGGLRLLDQRAAQGRVVFEKLLSQKSKTEVQTLLIPHTLEVTPFESSILKENLSTLKSLGIEIEEFGTNAYIIQALPQVFNESNVQQLITDIVQSLREFQDSKHVQQEREKAIALAAARSTISKGKKLSLQEAQLLVGQLMKCEKPRLSPQGKPTIVELSPAEIEKLFLR